MKLSNIEVLVCIGDDTASLNCKACRINIDWREDWSTLEEAVEIANNHQCQIEDKSLRDLANRGAEVGERSES